MSLNANPAMSKKMNIFIPETLNFLGSFGLFLVGLKVMSDSLMGFGRVLARTGTSQFFKQKIYSEKKAFIR